MTKGKQQGTSAVRVQQMSFDRTPTVGEGGRGKRVDGKRSTSDQTVQVQRPATSPQNHPETKSHDRHHKATPISSPPPRIRYGGQCREVGQVELSRAVVTSGITGRVEGRAITIQIADQ